jgi:hypothetical protein
MPRPAPEKPSRSAVPLEPPLDFDDEEDSLELLVTEENGASSRVICIPIDGEVTSVTALPPVPSPSAHPRRAT